MRSTAIGERILVVADDLFYRRGITAVGVELIAEEAETTKRTLYQRFGSKDGLVEAYLRRRGSTWQQYLVDRLDAAGWTLAELFRSAGLWAVDHRRGCAFVNAWAEVGGELPSRAAGVVRAEKEWMRDLVVELAGGDAGVGTAVHQLYEGAQVAATVLGEPESFRTAHRAARVLRDARPDAFRRCGVHGGVMSDSTAITVERVIDHSAAEIFEFLSNPENHARLDGSGFVRGDYKTDRVQQVGDVFAMDMEGEHMGGEYRTENRVTGFAKDKLLAWQTAPAGTEPKGWEWVWELEPQGPDSTLVRHTYDWSKVTDKDVLKKVSFPLVSEKQLEDSLGNLASAVAG